MSQITAFMHCARCLREMPKGESPESWARLNVGLTPKGIQVWCVRHDVNVAHVDFGDADPVMDTSEAGEFK